MTRLYSSFDLDEILREDLERKVREQKESEARDREAKIEELRAKRGAKNVPADSSSEHAGSVIAPVPLIVYVSLQALDLSRFHLGETVREYHLFGLPVGNEFVNLGVTKALLDGGNPHLQVDWRDAPKYRTLAGVVYDVPSGPEFEAIVEVAAAYRPNDQEQSRLLSGLTKLVVADLEVWPLSRSRVRFAAKGRDGLSSDYGRTYVQSVDLKGKAVPITPQSGLDAALGALLSTTTVRYCEARQLLGVSLGMLYRWEAPRDGAEWPLSIGVYGGVGAIVLDGSGRARGVRRIPPRRTTSRRKAGMT